MVPGLSALRPPEVGDGAAADHHGEPGIAQAERHAGEEVGGADDGEVDAQRGPLAASVRIFTVAALCRAERGQLATINPLS